MPATIDYQKAFDTENHRFYLSQMERCGIRAISFEIFMSYLHARTHKLKIGKTVTDWLTINIGVLQGYRK